MVKELIRNICIKKEKELLEKYFGNIVKEASDERPESIGKYTEDLPLKIEEEYHEYLSILWGEHAPEEFKDKPLVLEETNLRELLTEEDKIKLDEALKNAKRITLKERISQTNHKDVTFYKGLLYNYTKDVLLIMREDFLEEITGIYIKNKAFENN